MSPCFECGQPSAHEHHVIPRSLGGTRTVPLCEGCHSKVHGHDLHIRALTTHALQAKRVRGERAGAVPFGFTADAAGRLAPNEAEQRVIATVHTLRAAGRPLRAVVSDLAQLGFRSRAGAPFQLTQVARLDRLRVAP